MKFKSGKYYVVMEYSYEGNKLTNIKRVSDLVSAMTASDYEDLLIFKGELKQKAEYNFNAYKDSTGRTRIAIYETDDEGYDAKGCAVIVGTTGKNSVLLRRFITSDEGRPQVDELEVQYCATNATSAGFSLRVC